MLTMKDWPKIKKAYEDVIAEVAATIVKDREMKRPGISEYGEVSDNGNVTLPFVQVWEDYMPRLEYNHMVSKFESYSCPHTKDGKVKRVLELINEGGYNSAGICLDCLMEWAERNRSRIWP